MRHVLVLLAIALTAAGGCRSLPRNTEPPEPTYAFAPTETGPLAEFADACGERIAEGESGFLFVERNDEDLHWRLALVDSAQRSIDVQTYLWYADFSGRLLIDRMLRAADRGVRVRLLVDDFLLRGRDRGIAALDDHPNVEVRIWNPARSRALGRNLEFLARLRELNHRLHNKVLIADNRVVLSGGRNIADAYYGLSDKYNFLDLDLLAVGPVVPPTSDMFDRYWNSMQAVPGRLFHPRGSVDDLPEAETRRRRELAASPMRAVFPLEPQAWDERLARGAAEMVTGRAEVIYDKPGEREPSQDALIGLQRFIRAAEREVLALNAYLVPGEAFFDEARKLEERGVHMAIMTNSLGSTNQTVVHHAYARTRQPTLEAGVDVYEMRYDAALKAELDTPPAESAWVGLHAKAVVIDRRLVFIGSFNFSPRSRNLNTEMGLLVDSPALGAQVADFMERTMAPENAWRLVLDEDGRLAWESSDGRVTTQPAQSFWQRVKNDIFGMFPLEEHL
jgi:putative cardiolipin synthase